MYACILNSLLFSSFPLSRYVIFLHHLPQFFLRIHFLSTFLCGQVSDPYSVTDIIE